MFSMCCTQQELYCWQQADEDVTEDEATKPPVSPAKSEPKVASFSWATKLSAASSTGSSGAQPNLLQSLTGSLSGTKSLNRYIEADFSTLYLYVIRKEAGPQYWFNKPSSTVSCITLRACNKSNREMFLQGSGHRCRHILMRPSR